MSNVESNVELRFFLRKNSFYFFLSSLTSDASEGRMSNFESNVEVTEPRVNTMFFAKVPTFFAKVLLRGVITVD